MIYKSKHPIEWCSMSRSPAHGCLHGCPYCYAQKLARRMGGMRNGGGYRLLKLDGLDPFTPMIDFEKMRRLDSELTRKRAPQRVFLGSMADLGGDWTWKMSYGIAIDDTITWNDVSGAEVRQHVVDLIARHPRHTFLILTKWPRGLAGIDWPDNAQIGVSVSDKSGETLDRLIDLDVDVSARTKWVSIEPLLDSDFGEQLPGEINWVVIGAQTGRGAPPPEVAAAKRIVQYCQAKGIPCFVKSNMRCADPDFDWPREVVW